MKRQADSDIDNFSHKKIKIQNENLTLKRKLEDNECNIPNKKIKFSNNEENILEKFFLENEILKKENQELKFYINNELEKIKNDNERYIKSLCINHTNHFVF